MSLRLRFWLGSLALLALVAVASGLVLRAADGAQVGLRLLSEGYQPLSQSVIGIKASPLGLAHDGGDPERQLERIARLGRREQDVIVRMAEELSSARDRAEAFALGPIPAQDAATFRSVGAQLSVVLELLAAYRAQHEAFVAMWSDRPDEAAAVLPELADLRRQIDLNLRVLNRRLARRQSQIVEDVLHQQDEGRTATLVVSTLALVVGVLVLFSVGRGLEPIRRLIASAERIREGRFEERVRVEGSDEVARLARAFNAMAASVEERGRGLAERTAELERALTELQSREVQLVRSERLAAIGHMAAQVAHEVRNPLNALGLNAEMLQDELVGGDPDEARAMVAAIRREVARLADITEAYLALGRLPPLRIEPMAVEPLLTDLARFLREEAERQGVEVVVAPLPPLPRVAADQAQIWQALLNIVRNALEALVPAGRGRVTLHAVAEPGGRELRIDVEDDGPGMPADVVSRIFDPFFSTKERGSGLGLPITHQVLTEHGGRIQCRSTPGEGTTFQLWLPLSKGQS